MMLRGWQVVFHYCPAIAQITLSYKAVSFIEVGCFPILWNAIALR